MRSGRPQPGVQGERRFVALPGILEGHDALRAEPHHDGGERKVAEETAAHAPTTARGSRPGTAAGSGIGSSQATTSSRAANASTTRAASSRDASCRDAGVGEFRNKPQSKSTGAPDASIREAVLKMCRSAVSELAPSATGTAQDHSTAPCAST